MEGMRTFRRGFLRAVGAAAALSGVAGADTRADGPYVDGRDEVVALGNDHLELKFRRDNGGLAQFTGKQPEFDLRADGPFPALNWSLQFYGDDVSTASYLGDSPDISTEQTGDEARVTLQWSDPPLRGTGVGASRERFAGQVTVDVTLGADDRVSRWYSSVRNDGDRAISEIRCPQVTNVRPLNEDGNDSLYVPRRFGRRARNPTTRNNAPGNRYPSGFGTMQFTTYLDDDRDVGVYAAAEDSEGYAKRLEFTNRSDEELLDYHPAHLVPYRPGEDLEVPYAMTLGVHEGGWQAACDRYRDWMETEGWLADAEPMVPERVREWGLTWHERSYTREGFSGDGKRSISFAEMRAMLEALQERFDVPMSFRWWGWAKHGWPALGDWLPPKEGLDAYRSAVQAMADADVDTVAFLNPGGTLRVSDYRDAVGNEAISRMAVTRRDGAPRTIEPGAGTILLLDHLEPTWRDHYTTAIEGVLEAGAREIDLDGFPWRGVPDCWNESHDHPPGHGGNWYATGMRALLRDLHAEHEVEGGLAISGEGIADFYLPYMNVHNTKAGHAEVRDQSYAAGETELVPMFPYTFGDYAELRSVKGHIGTGFPTVSQWLIAGRAIEWGAMPMTMGHFRPVAEDQQWDEDVVEYLARVGSARANYANRFLAGGEMLDRPAFDRRSVVVEGPGTIETSSVRGRGWRAASGDLGIVLTKISDEEGSRTLELDLTEQPYDLPEEPLVYLVENGRYAAVDGTTATLELERSDVVLLAAVSDAEPARDALAAIEAAQESELVLEDRLATARRAFDAHEHERASRLATEAVEAATPTATETQTETTAPTDPTGTASSTEPVERSDTATTADGPGFGIPGAVAGAAVLGTLFDRFGGDGDTDDSREAGGRE